MPEKPEFLPLKDALEYVTSVVLSPYAAQKRIHEKLENGELAAKADKIIHQRTFSTSVVDNWLVSEPFRNELGPDFVPYDAWRHADVNWNENRFERRTSLPIIDEYYVQGIMVSETQLRELFPAPSERPRFAPNSRPRGWNFETLVMRI